MQQTEHGLTGCPAPAKLNLFLHVIGRRPDGYHLLQTGFQLIDRSDLLHFSLRDDDAIRRTSLLPGVTEDNDLTVRAALLLQETCGIATPGVDIAIDKRLPMGGGLGGGSSDAATTLLALNHLWRTGLSRDELMKLGLKLGADVPFFLLGNNAFAEGVGETLTPINLPPRWFVVIEPGVAVPTATIFGAPELTRNTEAVTIADFSKRPFSFGKNDLEQVAAQRFPAVAEALKWLSKYGAARMTGSGACVFCAFDDERDADEVCGQAQERWSAWKAAGLSQHPLAAF